MHKQVSPFLLSLIVAAMACQTLVPSAEPTATVTPAEPMSTPTPQAAPIESILPQAEEACAAAENASVVGGFITTPILALKKVIYERGEWEVDTLLNNRDGVLAEDADAVRVVACIREERDKSGSYEDGEVAIATLWTIWFIAWPEGEVLGRMSLVGAAPPIKMNPGAGIGDPPVPDFVNVLLEAESHTFLAVEGTGALAQTAFAMDGQVMAVTDAEGQITSWDLESGNVLNQFAGHPDASFLGDLALSPDGSLVAVTGSSDSTTMVFDAETGANLYTLITEAPVFSPDGNVLATGNPTEEHIVTFEIWLTDPRSGSLIAKLPDARVEAMAFSADGRWLVSMDPFGELMLWDAASRTLVSSFEGFEAGGAESVAISPDGRLVAAQSISNGVRVWESDSWILLYSTEGENGAYQQEVRFSADGRRLAFAGPESLVDIFDSDEPPASGDIEAQVLAPRKITLVNLDDLSATEMQLPLQVVNFSFAPNGEGLYVVLAGGVVLLIGDATP